MTRRLTRLALGLAARQGAAAVQAVRKRAIPSDATLVFDVVLVAIVPPKAP